MATYSQWSNLLRMKLLTATHEGQGDREGDFCFACEGAVWPAGTVVRRVLDSVTIT